MVPPDEEIDVDIEEDIGTTVLHRKAEFQPPRSLRSFLIGRPLATADAPHQTSGKLVGLAVFASDPLSSTAHTTQEILVILAAAGTIAFGIEEEMSLGDMMILLKLRQGEYSLVEEKVPAGGKAAGLAIKDLSIPDEDIIAGVILRGRITVLEPGDEILAITDRREAGQLASLLASTMENQP